LTDFTQLRLGIEGHRLKLRTVRKAFLPQDLNRRRNNNTDQATPKKADASIRTNLEID
jgi:hypothetical protein